MFTACHVLKECQTNANHDASDWLDKGTGGHRGQRQHPSQNVMQDTHSDGVQFPRDPKTADLQTITNSQMLCRRTITENLAKKMECSQKPQRVYAVKAVGSFFLWLCHGNK